MNKGKKVCLIIVAIIGIAILACGCYFGSKKLSKATKDNTNVTEEKEESVKVKYSTEKYNKSTEKKNIQVFNTLTLPESINIDNGEEIVSYMKEVTKETWETIKEDTDEAIENYDPDFQYDDTYGAELIATHKIYNDVITFTVKLEGGFGGVEWYELHYYNFSLKTGKILELKDLCNDTKECKKFIKATFMNNLEKDERFPDLYDDYESDINDNLYTVGSYGFTDEGFTMIIQRYSIASGASGSFIYDIAKEDINKYLKDEYQM